MNKQLLSQHLNILGLDETEILLYVSLLERGPQTLLELSRKTGINRSKIYRYIERLKGKRLIEEIDTSRGLKIQAAQARNLELLIKERETEIKEQREILPAVLTELKNLAPRPLSTFEIKNYHGLEGLKQMTWNQLSARSEILQFAFETRNEVVGKNFAEKVREEQVLRGITLYEVENAIDQGRFDYTKVPDFPRFYRSRHIPVETLEIKQNLAVFNDTVSIMNWSGENKSGVEVTNAAFAKMQREIFWEFWKIAAKSR